MLETSFELLNAKIEKILTKDKFENYGFILHNTIFKPVTELKFLQFV